MHSPKTETQAAIAREYAEALIGVLRKTMVQWPTTAAGAVTQPMQQYASLLAEKLGVGCPDHVNGLDRVTLFEAMHALQHLGCYLDRAKHAQLLSPTRRALILELHKTTLKEVRLLLRTAPT